MASGQGESLRERYALAPAIIGAVIAGLMISNADARPVICALIAVSGAVISGALDGTSLRNRLTSTIGYTVGAFIFIAVLLWYVHATGRTRLTRFELLIPVAAGAVPVLIIRFIAGKGLMEKVPVPALAALVLALVGGPLFFASQMPDPNGGEVLAPETELVLHVNPAGEIIDEGEVLTDERLSNIVAGWAERHPGSKVVLKAPKGADLLAASRRATPAVAQQGLTLVVARDDD